jgi:hypothetical protein
MSELAGGWARIEWAGRKNSLNFCLFIIILLLASGHTTCWVVIWTTCDLEIYVMVALFALIHLGIKFYTT